MATKATGWEDYALLTPTKGGKPWKVQVNAEGRFRCSCPAFIFCKGEKSCKHTRRCVEQRFIDQNVAIQTAPAFSTPKVSPSVDEATKACDAMLRAAKMFANETQKTQMVEVLAARLRSYKGAPALPAAVMAPVAVTVGLRLISFDD